jgi:hypothetical protein
MLVVVLVVNDVQAHVRVALGIEVVVTAHQPAADYLSNCWLKGKLHSMRRLGGGQQKRSTADPGPTLARPQDVPEHART